MREQEKKWQEDFEKWYSSVYMNSPIERHSDSYIHAHIASNWETWKAAKRSQPIVKLPKPNRSYDIISDYFEQLEKSLTAAGIRFEVEE